MADGYRDGYRDDFRMDCAFGMPGVSMDRTRLVQSEDGKFTDERNERLFQVWLRGVAHQRVEVRNHYLRQLRDVEPESDAAIRLTDVLRELQAAGLAAPDPGG